MLGKDAKDIYAVQRVQCKSDLLINFLNEFGMLGGFKMIMKTVEDICKSQTDKSVKTVPIKEALPLLSTYCECLGKASPVFYKAFAHEIIP